GTRGSRPSFPVLPRRGRGTPHRNLKTPNPRTARVPTLAPFVPASCPDAPVPRCLLLCHLSKPTSPHIRRASHPAAQRPPPLPLLHTPLRTLLPPPGDGGAGGRGPPLPPASAHSTSVTPRNSRPTAPTPAQPPGAVHPPLAAASPNRTATVRERTERTSSQAPESSGAPTPRANTHILRPEGAAGCSHGCSVAAPAAERNPWITSARSTPAPKGQRNTAHRLTAPSSAHGARTNAFAPSSPPHASMPPASMPSSLSSSIRDILTTHPARITPCRT